VVQSAPKSILVVSDFPLHRSNRAYNAPVAPGWFSEGSLRDEKREMTELEAAVNFLYLL